MSNPVDDLQNQRMDNIEARLTAIENLVLEVRANAKLLKVLAFGVLAMAGLNVQDLMV
jgi:hypothetical protein